MRVRANIGCLSRDQITISLPAYILILLNHYVGSLLAAENHRPTPKYIVMFNETFSKLISQARLGEPLVYKKRKTLSLMFEVFEVFVMQSKMSIESPDELLLAYTHSMMGFLLPSIQKMENKAR